MSKKYNQTDIMLKKISHQAERLGDGLAFFDFYDPSQQRQIERELKDVFVYYDFFGGHSLCERKMLCLSSEEIEGHEEIPWPMALCACNINFHVDHRMILGTVMSLGIERETIGDIIIQEDSIQIVAKGHIAEFIAMNIEKINNHRIHLKVLPIEQMVINEPEFDVKSVSVASFRIDAMISSAYGISREEVATMIKKGGVKINHEERTKPSQLAEVGDLFSVRGKGRFIFEECTGTTKKGRMKVQIKKYV